MIAPALGKREFDRDLLRGWFKEGLDRARLPLPGTRLTVRWTGEVNGQPAALFTLREPGRGVVAFAMHGTTTAWRTDLRLLLPAAGADRRPIAWRLRAEGADDPTGQVVVTAPAGAARVTLTPAGSAPVDLDLDGSGMALATLGPDAAATVTSYAADGSPIASTPVPAFDGGGGVIGEHPATRVVP